MDRGHVCLVAECLLSRLVREATVLEKLETTRILFDRAFFLDVRSSQDRYFFEAPAIGDGVVAHHFWGFKIVPSSASRAESIVLCLLYRTCFEIIAELRVLYRFRLSLTHVCPIAGVRMELQTSCNVRVPIF